MKVRLGGKGGRIVRSLSQVTPRELSTADVEAEIARVAEAHQPDGGYGETAWNADSKTVYWVCADWTSNDEHDAARADFLAIDGVDAFEHDAEAALPSGEGWTQVWPRQRPTEAATAAERWDRLIGELEESGQLDAEPMVAAAPAVAVAPEPPSPLEQAFAVMGRLVDAVAARPQPPAPVVHVHNHDPDLSVNVHPAAGPNVNVTLPDPEPPQVTVENHNHLPEQEPPSVAVTVEAAEAPDVHVQVESPSVHVEPPAVTVAAAAPPEVHVTVEQTRPGPVRLEVGEDGVRRFVPEEDPETDRE